MDKILRTITSDGSLMASAIDSSQIVYTAQKIHGLTKTSCAALGRLLTGASLMGNMLKTDGASLTLKVNGGGPLGNLGQSEDNYPAGALDGVITGFLAQAAQALEPYGTKLSLHASADVLTGADGSAGLTTAALNASADRLWVSGTRSGVLAALEGAGVKNAADRLVSLVDQLDSAAADAQAVWGE